MNKNRILIICTLFWSCGLLSKTSHETKTSGRLQARVEMKSQSSLEEANKLQISDSSHNDYHLEIMPIGSFKFSLQDGFDGNAAYVRIRGHSTAIQKEQADHKRKSSTQRELVQSLKVVNTANEQVASKFSWKFSWIYYAAIIALLGFFLVWLLKRKI